MAKNKGPSSTHAVTNSLRERYGCGKHLSPFVGRDAEERDIPAFERVFKLFTQWMTPEEKARTNRQLERLKNAIRKRRD